MTFFLKETKKIVPPLDGVEPPTFRLTAERFNHFATRDQKRWQKRKILRDTCGNKKETSIEGEVGNATFKSMQINTMRSNRAPHQNPGFLVTEGRVDFVRGALRRDSLVEKLTLKIIKKFVEVELTILLCARGNTRVEKVDDGLFQRAAH